MDKVGAQRSFQGGECKGGKTSKHSAKTGQPIGQRGLIPKTIEGRDSNQAGNGVNSLVSTQGVSVLMLERK